MQISSNYSMNGVSYENRRRQNEEASDFPRTFPNISKRSFSPTLIGAYFSLSEIRKIPSLSFCNFLI